MLKCGPCLAWQVSFSMVWDKNCVEFMYLSRNTYVDSAKIWDKRAEKLPNISLSLDFLNKPPSSNKPPLY